MPPRELYEQYLDKIWDSHWVTNQGPLLTELENKIAKKLNTDFVQVVSNGTIAIQLAIKALGIKGEVITTPYSYVATVGATLWENCTPVFCDIENKHFCIDANLIEAKITPRTTAILATHVYGLPCDVEKIETIAQKHNLKVIYDGAHAFGCFYKGKSLLNYGDVTTCSLHATKVFHTIEGGLVIASNKELHDKMMLLKSFGHKGDDHYSTGVNGKTSEFNAAMGLCLVDLLDGQTEKRKKLYEAYREILKSVPVSFPVIPDNFTYNYAYFPVLFESEGAMQNVKDVLAENGINTRRYFYPSLNRLPYLENQQSCPVSEDAASRVLCLPFYYELSFDDATRIAGLVKKLLT
ncbi:MAG TPA: DegT/DnrJ/EryC1/StrS family aminotransferase [Chitinophagales bacterium]|nr:DegT/DnrJ/EryC1/StrS family aminotransferase [Chitinophagales bacterium]